MNQEQNKYKIFISSTMTDLQNERNVISDIIYGLNQIPVRVETTSSEPTSSRNVIFDLIHSSDILLGIYGARYGFIPFNEKISVTEMEFNIAKDAGKDILIYIQDTSTREREVEAFLRRIQDFDSGLFRRPFFKDINQLASWVQEDLRGLIEGDNFHVFTFKEYIKKIDDWVTRYENKWNGVYTELSAISTSSVKFSKTDSNNQLTPQSLSRIIENNRVVVITGDGGAGKTITLLNAIKKQATTLLNGTDRLIPVYVPLNTWTDNYDLQSLIQANLGYLGKNITNQLLERYLIEGRFTLQFDGINEIPYKHRSNGAEMKLVNFIKKYSKNRFLITSRLIGFNASIFQEFPIYQIQPLNKNEVIDIINAKLGKDIGQSLFIGLGGEDPSQWYKPYSLINLARNPFFLWMITEFYLSSNQIPKDKGLLIKSYTQFIFEIRDKNKANKYNETIKNSILSQLAFEMLEAGEIVRTTKKMVLDSLSNSSKILKEKMLLKVDETIFDILDEIQSNGFLELLEDGSIKWSHQLFQDYFGGLEIARRFDSNNSIWKQLNKVSWKDSIVLATSLTNNPEFFVNEVLNGKKGILVKVFHENARLVLATDCVNQTNLWENTLFRENINKEVQYRLNHNINHKFKEFSYIFFRLFGKIISPFLLRIEKSVGNNRNILEPILWCLGETRDPKSIIIFEKYLGHEDKGLRWVASDALGKLQSSSSLEKLIDLLDDYDADVRWVTIQALISIADPRASQSLINLLDHPDPSTRWAAISALGKIGNEDCLENLKKIRESDNAIVWWGETISQTANKAIIEISNRTSLTEITNTSK